MSPLNKTYTGALDRPEPIELVLEIPSFAGGENTIGEDQELRVNEARGIENWDAISLGGMERSKGFSEVADATYRSSVSPSLSPSQSSSPSLSPSVSPSLSTSPSKSPSVSPSASTSPSKSPSISPSASTSPSKSPSISPSLSTSPSISPSISPSQSTSPSISPSQLYTAAPDGLFHHFESSTVRNFVVIEGDLTYINGNTLTNVTNNLFTNGILCGGVSAGSACWITNSTDNLKRCTISGGGATPSGVPSSARERIYYHKSRLIAEGGGVTIFGSRAGTGNWNSGNTWSASGDAWNIDLPDITKGAAPNFPSGNEILVFTKFSAYALFNFPNVAFRPLEGAHGCNAPFSVAGGNEGVFFLSTFPTLGIFLFDRVNWINLTINEDWVQDINQSARMFGIYREGKYYFSYNESGSGVTYPNRVRIYDTKFGRWMYRKVNPDLGDYFGYPAVLHKSNNELYMASSVQEKIYELETTSNSDAGFDTQANYKTKDFTSKDFGLPRDEVRMKLLKSTITYYGTTGNFSLYWTADRGLAVGSTVVTMSAEGDILNESFILNSSLLSSSPPDKTLTRSFNNAAVGRRFSFQILNEGMGVRPKIKKIKILALALEEA